MNDINTEIYRQCGLNISHFLTEPESEEYDACQFELNGQKIIRHNAKITPKKRDSSLPFGTETQKESPNPILKKTTFTITLLT